MEFSGSAYFDNLTEPDTKPTTETLYTDEYLCTLFYINSGSCRTTILQIHIVISELT